MREAQIERLRFAVDDYLCRMHGVISSHGLSVEDANRMLEYVLNSPYEVDDPRAPDWLTAP